MLAFSSPPYTSDTPISLYFFSAFKNTVFPYTHMRRKRIKEMKKNRIKVSSVCSAVFWICISRRSLLLLLTNFARVFRRHFFLLHEATGNKGRKRNETPTAISQRQKKKKREIQTDKNRVAQPTDHWLKGTVQVLFCSDYHTFLAFLRQIDCV